jgi:S-adenosylmethionine-diacylglycerol 3-amino-3-carboxypropyl transferase
MDDFFSRLSYSFGNEDWKTEQAALKIQPKDKVLCITASGDRPLNLLMNECSEIVSIDANPIQNYLLDLKMAAMQLFPHDRYLSFLGVKKNQQRLNDFKHLLPFLEKDSAAFWKKNQKMIEKGVLYQGTIEKFTKLTAKIMGIVRHKTIKKLFSFNDLNEQRQFVKEHWDKKWWKKTFELILNPSISKFFIHDPGLVNVATAIHPGTYIYERILDMLNQCLANENLLFSLIFQGYVPQAAFSPYLTHEGTQVIKTRLDRLTINTGEIVQYLESIKEPTFDCFSLSDIASYMDHSHFVRLLNAVRAIAKPGARFCIRQFLSSQKMPDELSPFFERDYDLEKRLEQQDKCFIYRFTTGSIKKQPEVIHNTKVEVSEKLHCVHS